MAQLIVRNIERSVVLKLKRRAAKGGVSMEEELRRVIRESVAATPSKPKKSFMDLVCEAPDFGDPYLLRQKDRPREVNFD